MLSVKETDTNTLKSYFENNQKIKVIPVTNVNFGNLKSSEQFSAINNNNGSSSSIGTKRNMEEKSEHVILKKIKSVVGETIDDNTVYEGKLSPDGKYHGEGRLTKGNLTYKGKWENGKLPYGIREGLNKNKRLVKYEGHFNDNLDPHGFGTLSNDAGKYEGNFINGVFHGQGKFVIQDYTYEGTWEKGILKEGIKKKVIKDKGNITYKGQFVKMQLHGYGEKIYLNNGKYTGIFCNGLEEGYGIFESENLSCEGFWEKGFLTKGKSFDKKTKIVYEGDFDKELKLQDEGELCFPSGIEFNSSLIATQGKVESVNGIVPPNGNEESLEQSEFDADSSITNLKEENNNNIEDLKDSKHEKKRTLFFHEGKYHGYVKNNLPHGQGILSIETKMYEGEWNEGKLSFGTVVEDGKDNELYSYTGELYNLQFHGQGTLSFKEFKYEGSFKNDLCDGNGVWTTPSRKFHVKYSNNTLQRVIRTTNLAGKRCNKSLELDEEILLFLSLGIR